MLTAVGVSIRYIYINESLREVARFPYENSDLAHVLVDALPNPGLPGRPSENYYFHSGQSQTSISVLLVSYYWQYKRQRFWNENRHPEAEGEKKNIGPDSVAHRQMGRIRNRTSLRSVNYKFPFKPFKKNNLWNIK